MSKQRILLTVTLALIVLATPSITSAQIPPPPPGLPYDFGQWDGPYHHPELA